MAITSILECQFQPDRIDEALEILGRMLVDTRGFDGCLGVDVVADHEDPAHVLLVERWASLEQDAAYRVWRAGEGATPEMAAVSAGPPRLVVATPLDGV